MSSFQLPSYFNIQFTKLEERLYYDKLKQTFQINVKLSRSRDLYRTFYKRYVRKTAKNPTFASNI